MSASALSVSAVVSAGPGRPEPLGATADRDGVNFAVHSTASALWLLLLDPVTGATTGEYRFRPEHRVGTVHTMRLDGPGLAGVGYELRVQRTPEQPPIQVVDPYAKVFTTTGWGQRPHRRTARVLPEQGGARGPRPQIAPQDLIIYETHVRGFTRSPSSRVRAPGTYAGLIEKIPYLQRLGVNCVELLPVAEFDETDNTYSDPAGGAPLLNFWGYNPVAFFAPKASYAATEPDAEFAALVAALHRAGIQVVLDVVFNHTAEGDHRGPDLSLRALDEQAYYLLDPAGRPVNLTATGNTVQPNHPVTSALILDCLRHWVTRYNVDGFRFDMASILTRGHDGRVMADPPLIATVAGDPVLAGRLLIAEATDATGLDQTGSFPHHHRWAEWNARYRDAVRRFLLARPGSTAEMATRLAGSPDLYPGRGPVASINYVTCHDGLTLADWTSYDRRHNEANGEDSRDGIADEDSSNHGHEGPTVDPAITVVRRRQQRNALALLFTSRGVPMLLAGDESRRTQGGNNNAYSQDNATSWLDWDTVRENADLVRFTRHLIAQRGAHPVLRLDEHPDGRPRDGWPLPPISWHGTRPGAPDWGDESRLLVALLYHRDDDGIGDAALVAANTADTPVEIRLPAPPPGTHWSVGADTAATPPSHAPGTGPALATDTRTLQSHSVLLLTAAPDERT
ncbi:alpha-amylase family glycosyl hydrolase [Micromonospora sp. WMMD714]|uniref:glycogen debranching protein n=1 Tax=Micromonospora sp. WMMD714 TaxID=3016097 RepID=UPI00249A0BD7|nr:alpha-amylase family glycosyl hydrolase [Micromonospora sp. WMMD714]WFE62835.1 alpha-amylase family glycosyl hydrolase [Micromonospora sp. WMMD714]